MTEERERWIRVKAAFEHAEGLDTGERQKFIDRLKADERTLATEVEQLLAVDDDAANFMSKPPVLSDGPDMIGRKLGKYQIVREIGRGGMGAVFEAVREEGDFDHRAAIKLTGHNLFSEDLISRFRSEKQILANLEHPNIVRLLDGGVTPEHIPYYVMEYVEGEPITRYCRRFELSIMERLRLFRQVCDAVAYAHRQLVVHRDLKPSNILVTVDGNVKLLDFGIAKVLSGEDSGATTHAPLTPEYASPEQIKGGTITVASDIFSLGVVLFELLTDRPPNEIYGVAKDEMFFAVLNSEPVNPSAAADKIRRESTASSTRAVNELRVRSLRGDLDNIAQKCLTKEPGLRFRSVDELAADLQSYADGRPVSAHPQSAVYRAQKFIRRNRGFVISAAAAIAMIITGVSIAVWQWSSARRQQTIAEQRFAQVRKIANVLIFDYHDEIAKLPGSTLIRERLVSDAIAYLDAISADRPDDPQLLYELGIAYRKIGDVMGLAYQANLGDLPAALTNYQRSIEMLARSNEIGPGRETLIADILETYRAKAMAESRLGQKPQARETLRNAIQQSKDHNFVTVDTVRVNALSLRLSLALGDTEDTDLEAARQIYGDALAMAMEIDKRFPSDFEINRLIAKFNHRLAANSRWIADYGPIEWRKRRAELTDMAVEYARKYVEYNNIADSISGQERPRELADGYLTLTNSLIDASRLDEAEKWVAMADFRINEVKMRDSQNAEILLDELGAFNARRRILSTRGRLAEAITVIDKALGNAMRYSENDRSNIETISWVGHFAKEGAVIAKRLSDIRQESRYNRIFHEYAGHYRQIVGTDWSGNFGF